LVKLIAGETKTAQRPAGMGFWDYPAKGISTPSAKWMAELLAVQEAGRDLAPHVSSQRAAELPRKPFPTDDFPGHAAWIDGDWKLHRIADKRGVVKWEMYDLANDRVETKNRYAASGQREQQMRSQLESWLRSVVRSLNGADYASP
ncbi:MAG: N-acetylgalactosamine 6-sulfate sulfatase, partial [Planctomycetaceae bacterium]